MKYKNIIFDFDGVLAESVHIKTQAFYKLYEKFGKEIAKQVIKHHEANTGMSRFEKFPYYHKTFLNINLTKKDIEKLCNNFSRLVIDRVVEAKEVSGALYFLKKHQKVIKYWIASATPIDEINKIAKKRGIADYFIRIYGSPNNKKEIVKNILKENNLKHNETVFLGDAMSDFKGAQENNIDFMLRVTKENEGLFIKYSAIMRFIDFYQLDRILQNQ